MDNIGHWIFIFWQSTLSNQERWHRFSHLFLLFFFHSIINTRCGLYWSLSIHFLVISIVPNENMMVDCQLSDLVFEVSHDFSGIICILQFVLMKCITAPKVTLFSRSTRISRRPGALSRSPMVASLDSQKCHWTLSLHHHHPKYQLQNNTNINRTNQVANYKLSALKLVCVSFPDFNCTF